MLLHEKLDSPLSLLKFYFLEEGWRRSHRLEIKFYKQKSILFCIRGV